MNDASKVPDQLREEASELVRAGAYATLDDALVDAGRLLKLYREREDQRLREALQEGLESGDPIPAEAFIEGFYARNPHLKV